MSLQNPKSRILIESQYLPCIAYFVVLQSFDETVVEVEEHYVKQTYRNRCRVMTNQGPYELSIPVKHRGEKVKMKDVRIDYQQKWVQHHWRTLQTAYGKAPFYEYFGALFKEVYDRKFTYLLDLNMEFFLLCQKLLSQSLSLKKSQVYLQQPSSDLSDWRSKIHPKKGLNNNPFYKPCNYNQIFGKKFVSNLSIIDLLFCEGPGAMTVIRSCQKSEKY